MSGADAPPGAPAAAGEFLRAVARPLLRHAPVVLLLLAGRAVMNLLGVALIALLAGGLADQYVYLLPSWLATAWFVPALYEALGGADAAHAALHGFGRWKGSVVLLAPLAAAEVGGLLVVMLAGRAAPGGIVAGAAAVLVQGGVALGFAALAGFAPLLLACDDADVPAAVRGALDLAAGRRGLVAARIGLLGVLALLPRVAMGWGSRYHLALLTASMILGTACWAGLAVLYGDACRARGVHPALDVEAGA